MPLRIHPLDQRIAWEGHVTLQETPNGVRAWRLPHERLPLFVDPRLQQVAGMPAGVRLRFRTDSTTIAGTLNRVDDLPPEEHQPIDLVVNGDVAGSQKPDSEFSFESLETTEKVCELWLPQYGECALAELRFDDGASVTDVRDDRRRWIAYGSSITQCRQADSPTQTWPSIVARRFDLNLTCLGYGGACHLDVEVARVIRGLPADCISMCLGINIFGSNAFSARSFKPAVIGFVQLLREGHPDVPLVIQSPIYGANRETQPNKVGYTLPRKRRELAEAVELLREFGDANIHYIDGLSIFGEADAHLLPDNLHPNNEGYVLMAERISQKTVPLLLP
jgi:lysophospholipase L1-like esterase